MEIIIDYLRRMREFDCINKQFDNGETVMHIACKNGNFKMCKMLIDLMNPNLNIKYIEIFLEILKGKYQKIMLKNIQKY